ncbi:SpoIIE family protein phosphatase, partial [Streptomyces sp. NPDC001856]
MGSRMAAASVRARRPSALLGIDGGATYATTEVDLSPGCVLALYTDGLI